MQFDLRAAKLPTEKSIYT